MTAPNQPPPGPQPPESTSPSDSKTRIIRRAPTGPLPIAPESPTTHIPPQPPPYAAPGAGPRPALAGEPGGRTAAAACAVSIVSGWATSVVATDLIAGWWRSDRLFCTAVAFLALVFAAATISGVIMLLQRRPFGRWLIVVGAVVAVLTYIGVFIAGARVAWIVHLLPLLPIASVVLALHPRTKRWLEA
ncbi:MULTISPECIES: hypothetical protein [unclassified Mycobacterium]|uniref:hypothetical protein n=1 Tax=unclassified Mycobacterium TaxID=2642494 RepID=UPI0007FB83C3|nr:MULTISPECIES: hypothetical protein [unclassified Mycobacterium]OBG57454.1 hypothetical protein A5702_10250 [Mycobacterium sp. E3339]OBH83624.1 hypothetical protein A5680_10910 [Mycobacterium sp. E2989]